MALSKYGSLSEEYEFRASEKSLPQKLGNVDSLTYE